MFELGSHLDDLSRRGLYRSRRTIDSPQGVELSCNGKSLINFSSNDYLGLANHPAVVEAFQSAANAFGVGSGAAHLICGHSKIHHVLEEALAAFTGRERALLFSTGYMANSGVISALVGRGDTVLEDRLNHASLLDGGLASGAKFSRYRHLDVADLDRRLAGAPGNKLVVTDGIFSMDGDAAPVGEISRVARQHDAWVMVDDAHGFGVLGQTGGGLLEQAGLGRNDVQVMMATLGKAFGTFGAFVAGSEELVEFLIQRARPYIYTTAMPSALASATLASLKIVRTEHWRREKLRHLIAYFRSGAEQLGLDLMPSATPIQPIVVGAAKKALAMSDALFAEGFLVGAIRPPTVPQNSARLRITFSALHEDRHIDQLLDALAKLAA